MYVKNINMIESRLHNLLVCLNRSIIRLSEYNYYYPPTLNLDKNQNSDELLKELEKVSAFLRVPELSYLNKGVDNMNKIKKNYNR